MKTLGRIVMSAILTALVAFSAQAAGEAKTKVLLISREGYSADLDLMIKMEVGVMKLLLNNANLEVDVATTSGLPIVGTTEKIAGIKQLRNVRMEDYAGLILACMAVGGAVQPYPAVPAEVIALVKQAVADGKPVAANGNSPVVLAEAGVLKGRKYSFVRDPLKATEKVPFTFPAFQDGIYSGTGVVEDGTIITSAICPTLEKTQGMENGTVKLTKTFISAVRNVPRG